MPLDRTSSRFDKGKDVALGSLREQILTIQHNLDYLLNVRSGKKHQGAAKDFIEMFNRGESFTPSQMSYIEIIYEKCYEGAGYESAKRKIDKKRKGLNFG